MISKVKIRLVFLLASILFIIGFSIIFDSSSSIGKVVFGLDASTSPLTIQNAMWLCFFLGIAELFYRYRVSEQDVEALSHSYLVEEMGVFYNTELLTNVMKEVHDKDDRLAKLILALFMRYQASHKSTDETHQMLNSQLEMMQFKIDIDYNLVRYISWLIPTLGFVGTVVGISEALSYAGQPGVSEIPSFLSELTSVLAVAFNTTLVALIMSAVIVYGIHLTQGREEAVIQHCGEYCLNHFINKLMTQ